MGCLLLVRNVLGFMLFASAAITVGTTAYFVDQQARNELRVASPFILTLVTGGLTILWEVPFFFFRNFTRGPLSKAGIDLVGLGILFALWLAYLTHSAKQALSICRDLNAYLRYLRQRGASLSSLSSVSASFKKECPIIRTDLAFLWVGWAMVFTLFGWIVFMLATRGWRSTYRDEEERNRLSMRQYNKQGSIAEHEATV